MVQKKVDATTSTDPPILNCRTGSVAKIREMILRQRADPNCAQTQERLEELRITGCIPFQRDSDLFKLSVAVIHGARHKVLGGGVCSQ